MRLARTGNRRPTISTVRKVSLSRGGRTNSCARTPYLCREMTRDLPLSGDAPPPPGWPWRLPPPTAGSLRGNSPRRRTVWALCAALAIVGLVLLGSFVYFDDLIPGSNCYDWYVHCPLGPSDFSPVGIEKVSAGSIGCSSTTGEICFSAIFQASLQGLTLEHLRFVVANASAGGSTNGPLAPPLPLGAGAQVTALASPSSVAGVWNVSTGHWISGGSWPVSTGPGMSVILDTGLVSNTTLRDAEFDIVLTSPYEGAVGFTLY